MLTLLVLSALQGEVEEYNPPGLKFLAKRASDGGSWKQDHEIRNTALATLAFLTHGYTHLSKDRMGGVVSGHVIKRGLDYLASHLNSDDVPTHILATWALCEAYSLTSSARLKDSAQKALDLMIQKRHDDGGWGDPVSTAFAAMTLEAASQGELNFSRKDAVEKLGEWWQKKAMIADRDDPLIMSILIFIPTMLEFRPQGKENVAAAMGRWSSAVDSTTDEERRAVERHVQALDSDEPAERERAVAALRLLAERSRRQLSSRWSQTDNPEVKSRIEQTLGLHRHVDFADICTCFLERHWPDGESASIR